MLKQFQFPSSTNTYNRKGVPQPSEYVTEERMAALLSASVCSQCDITENNKRRILFRMDH